jgi:hypothetical protein
MLFKETLKWQFLKRKFSGKLIPEIHCAFLKKANTIRIYHLEIMKKKSIKFNGVMKIAALLKSAPKKKSKHRKITNIKIKKNLFKYSPSKKQSKLLRCPHQHFLRKPFFLKKSQKLEGLYSNTSAAQPKNPTIQTNKTGKVLVLSCPLSAAIKTKTKQSRSM